MGNWKRRKKKGYHIREKKKKDSDVVGNAITEKGTNKETSQFSLGGGKVGGWGEGGRGCE